MYGIFLNKQFNNPPEMSDLLREIPMLADLAFQQRLFPRSTTPGVLGLELPKDLAKRLLERFLAAGSEGYCFPAAYHHPILTLEQATLIAAQTIDKQRMEQDPTDLFHKRRIVEWYPGIEKEEKRFEPELTTNVLDAISLFREQSCYWEFLATSAHAREKRLIPGAWGASVDKLDGHLWQYEDVLRLHEGVLFG